MTVCPEKLKCIRIITNCIIAIALLLLFHSGAIAQRTANTVSDSSFSKFADGIVTVNNSAAALGCPRLRFRFTLDTSFIRFGWDVAAAGDVDNDGYNDFIVGGPDFAFNNFPGMAKVYSGRTGMPIYEFFGISNDTIAGQYGWAVDGVGDVNQDGFSDFIVAHARFNNAVVYSGISGDTLAVLSQAFRVDIVVGIGDTDGDGVDDIAVSGEAFFSSPNPITIYSGATLTPILIIPPDSSVFTFPLTVNAAGDVNGDGFADILVGTGNIPGTSISTANVYSGKTGLLLFRFTGKVGSSSSRNNLSGAGDVNGDGFDDVIWGSPQTDSGVAFIFYGDSIGGEKSIGEADMILTGDNTHNWFGASVAGVGDLDGDGFSDVVVGAAGGLGGSKPIYVFSGFDGSVIEIIDPPPFATDFGWALGATDVRTNDGLREIIVSAPLDRTNGFLLGRVFVYSLCQRVCRIDTVTWSPAKPRIYLDAADVVNVEVIECLEDPMTGLCNLESFPQAANIWFTLDSLCLPVVGSIDSVKLVPSGLTGQVFTLSGGSTRWSLYFLITNLVTPDYYDLELYYDDAIQSVIDSVLHYHGHVEMANNIGGILRVGAFNPMSSMSKPSDSGVPAASVAVALLTSTFQLVDTSLISPPASVMFTTTDGLFGWTVPDGEYFFVLGAEGFGPFSGVSITVPPGLLIDTSLVPLIDDTLSPSIEITYDSISIPPHFVLVAIDTGIGLSTIEFLYDTTANLFNLTPTIPEFVPGAHTLTIGLDVIDPADTSFFDIKVVDRYGNASLASAGSSVGGTCCVGSTGNIDNDPGDIVDIADLTFLIDHLFINFSPIVCPEEGNVDGDGGIDIADLTALIDHLFINFPPTAACQ